MADRWQGNERHRREQSCVSAIFRIWMGALRLHGRNPLFVPCSAYVAANAVLAMVDASAGGRMFSSIAAGGSAIAGAASRLGA